MSSKALTITKKDLLVEARTRQSIGMITLFTLMVVVAVGVTISTSNAKMTNEWSAVLLWIIILFGGSMALARSFSQETDKHTLDAMLICPIGRTEILMGKMISNFIFMLVVIFETLLLFSTFLDQGLYHYIWSVLLVMVLGGVGLAALGTTLSGIAARARAKEIAVITMMIPLALFTLIIPGIQSMVIILSGKEAVPQMLLLISLFDLVYIIAGYLLADHLFEE